MMSKNICRLDGNHIFLSVLRDDEEAVGLYAKWMSDETTCVFIEHAHSVVDITRMPGWVRDHSVMRMGIVLKETDTLIGYCHIDHRTEDMSAWLSINIGEKAARGKGIETEVVQILLRYCFMALGVYSVHLDVLETNTPAIKCYEKAGFRISGRYRGHCYYMRNHYDWLHMDILYEEYRHHLNLKGLHAKSVRKLAGTTKKSVGALKHRRTFFALLFYKSKNQKITESDAPRGSRLR